MKNIMILFSLLVFFSCNKPVADGAFVGQWYVLHLQAGYEHWEIDEKNNVFIYDKFKDTLRLYYLETKFYEKFFTDFPNFYVISEDKKDTIVFDWIEYYDYPPVIPEDTIRIYHSFVMVRADKLPTKKMNKSEIYDYFSNSTFKYQEQGTEFIVYLSEENIDHLKKRAYVRTEGCIDLSEKDAHWSLDTLSNSIIFEHSLFGRYVQTLFVNNISEDTVTADVDDFYWFHNNVKLIRTDNFEEEFYSPLEFRRNEIGKNGFECEF